MKKAYLLGAVICIALVGTVSYHLHQEEPKPNYGPLVFSSLEELGDAVNAVQKEQSSKFTQEYAAQVDEYALDELSFCYAPKNVPHNATLSEIRVKDRYVAIYYTLDIPLEEPVRGEESGKNELLGTMIFEWIRTEDGPELLRNTVEQQELLPLKENGEIYYSDIFWPGEPENILAKQLFWVQDGYMFSMHVPLSAFSQEMEENSVSAEMKLLY